MSFLKKLRKLWMRIRGLRRIGVVVESDDPDHGGAYETMTMSLRIQYKPFRVEMRRNHETMFVFELSWERPFIDITPRWVFLAGLLLILTLIVIFYTLRGAWQ